MLQTQVARQRSSVLSVMTLLCQVVAKVRRKWNLLKAEEEIKEGRLFLCCRTVSFRRQRGQSEAFSGSDSLLRLSAPPALPELLRSKLGSSHWRYPAVARSGPSLSAGGGAE